jgi:hypothetical protein
MKGQTLNAQRSTLMDSLHSPERTRWDHEPCSADFQSAVSRVSNPQAPGTADVPGSLDAPTHANAPPTESRRYSRLKTCATKARFMESSGAQGIGVLWIMNRPKRGTPDSSGSRLSQAEDCRMNPAFRCDGSWKGLDTLGNVLVLSLKSDSKERPMNAPWMQQPRPLHGVRLSVTVGEGAIAPGDAAILQAQPQSQPRTRAH